MATAADTFAPLIKDVAIALLGKPDQTSSKDTVLRWGSRGSFKVDVPDGTWFDHEAKEGGGTIDLVMREKGCDKTAALAWMRAEEFIEPLENDRVFYEYADETGAPPPDRTAGFWYRAAVLSPRARRSWRLCVPQGLHEWRPPGPLPASEGCARAT